MKYAPPPPNPPESRTIVYGRSSGLEIFFIGMTVGIALAFITCMTIRGGLETKQIKKLDSTYCSGCNEAANTLYLSIP